MNLSVAQRLWPSEKHAGLLFTTRFDAKSYAIPVHRSGNCRSLHWHNLAISKRCCFFAKICTSLFVSTRTTGSNGYQLKTFAQKKRNSNYYSKIYSLKLNPHRYTYSCYRY